MVWESEGQIYGRLTSGTTSEFAITSSGTSTHRYPKVAANGNGYFVVTWQSIDATGNTNIQAQAFDASAAATGSTFTVNTTTASTQQAPSIAMDQTGNYVIAWSSLGQDGDSWGIYGQRFTSSHAAAGSETQVNTQTTHAQQHVHAAITPSGTMAFAYTGYGGADGDAAGIFLSVYASDWTLQAAKHK